MALGRLRVTLKMSLWELSVPKRHEVLDIALNTTGSLQEAIDAAKHGAKTRSQGITSVQQILYGKSESIKTIVVTPDTTREEQLKRWFSVYPVKFSDLILSIQNPEVDKDIEYSKAEEDEDREVVSSANANIKVDNRIIVYIDMYKMHLFSVSHKEIRDYLESFNYTNGNVEIDTQVVNVPESVRQSYLRKYSKCHNLCLKILINTLDNNMILGQIRAGINLMKDMRVEVKGLSWSAENYPRGMVYSSLKGYVMEDIMILLKKEKAEEIFCTDTEKNVRLLGKLETLRLYGKYVSGANSKQLLGVILYSRPEMEAYDFSTVIEDSVFRALIIEQQRLVIKNAVSKNKKEYIKDIEEASMFLGLTNKK